MCSRRTPLSRLTGGVAPFRDPLPTTDTLSPCPAMADLFIPATTYHRRQQATQHLADMLSTSALCRSRLLASVNHLTPTPSLATYRLIYLSSQRRFNVGINSCRRGENVTVRLLSEKDVCPDHLMISSTLLSFIMDVFLSHKNEASTFSAWLYAPDQT